MLPLVKQSKNEIKQIKIDSSKETNIKKTPKISTSPIKFNTILNIRSPTSDKKSKTHEHKKDYRNDINKDINKNKDYDKKDEDSERRDKEDRRDYDKEDRPNRKDRYSDKEDRRDKDYRKDKDYDKEYRRDKDYERRDKDYKEDRRDKDYREDRRDKDYRKDKDYDKDYTKDYDKEYRRDKDYDKDYDRRDRDYDRDKDYTKDYERRDKRNRDYDRDKEEFVFSKLKDLLIDNKNKIVRLYAEDGNYKFIEIISLLDGEKIFIYIPSKYPIPISLEYPYIEITVVDLNSDFDELNQLNISQEELEDYKKIILLSKNKDTNVNDDELLNQEFQELDLEKDYLNNIKSLINKFQIQLERFQKITSKIKYKFGILTSRNLSVINRHNDIDHYIFKQPIKNITCKELIIVLDLESYYNKLDIKDDINIDIRKIYVNIFSAFTDIHSRKISELDSKFKYFSTIIDKIPSHYTKQQDYLNLLNSLTTKFIKLNESEKILQDKLIKTKYTDDTDISKSININKLQQEIDKLNQDRDETISLYREMKNKYTESMLSYDHILFDTIILSNNINKNLTSLKINKKI